MKVNGVYLSPLVPCRVLLYMLYATGSQSLHENRHITKSAETLIVSLLQEQE